MALILLSAAALAASLLFLPADGFMPILLATSAVHHSLIEAGLRTRTAITVEAGEPREDHHIACLIGYGAAIVHPYLALASARDAAAKAKEPLDPETASRNYLGALELLDELCGTSRSRTLVNARQIAMYLCRELTDMSLPKIGQMFGGRDHTTVIHADRKIRAQMPERRVTYNQVAELTNRIKTRSRQP